MASASEKDFDRSSIVYGGYRRARIDGDGGEWLYDIGYVRTSHGIVGVYTQRGYVVLTFIHKRRQYDRTVQRNVTDRGMATIAGRFARDVLAGRVK